jgi:hypothetical protein
MLIEAAETLLTPCPRYARVMGYLDELIGIGSQRGRCWDDWQPHLDRSQGLIRDAIAECPARRKAVVLGSGRLFDVPLDDLAAAFAEVVLVDLVHPLPVRWRCRKTANVHFAHEDVTGVAEQVYHAASTGAALPRSQPALFVDDPQVDMVVSVNLLSQLPYIPCRYLRRWNRYTAQEIEGFARHLIEAHLEYLNKFRGNVCLIADEVYLTYDENDRLIEERSALHGVGLPAGGESWLWRLAPRGTSGKRSILHRVRGIANVRGGLASGGASPLIEHRWPARNA